MIRLVATDLDGTLVRDDQTIGARSVAALERAEALGAAVVFVTARPIRWLHTAYEHLSSKPLAVAANGAAVYDPVDDKILHCAPLSPRRWSRRATGCAGPCRACGSAWRPTAAG